MTSAVGTIWTLSFWKDATERAIKTGAQSLALAIGGNDTVVDFWSLNLGQVGGVMAAGIVLSYATSLISAPFSNPGTASMTRVVESTPAVTRHVNSG